MIDLLLQNIFAFHSVIDADKSILNRNLIESAVNAPFQTFGGYDLYPTIFDKAAQLGFGLTKNHGFADGNKRVALHSAELLLLLHNYKLICSQNERVDVMLKLAKGEYSANDFKRWIMDHAVRFPSVVKTGVVTILPANYNSSRR